MGGGAHRGRTRLRVAGGAWRGRTLTSPPGARPTEQRVREALFSIWGEAVRGARLLDLYCGGGAVGLEALSRGAREVVAVDADPRALRAIAANRESLGAEALRSVRLSLPDQLRRLVAQEEPFDLVFADPPYEFRDYEPLLVATASLVRPDGELVLEHAASSTSLETVGPLLRIDLRTYGGTALSRYRHRASTR